MGMSQTLGSILQGPYSSKSTSPHALIPLYIIAEHTMINIVALQTTIECIQGD
jgi:hypothetical protein